MASDRISGLPNEVLVSIISLVSQRTAVSTSLLSKRFEGVWKYLEELSVFGCESNHEAVNDFLNNSLTTHLAPVLRRFKLILIAGDYDFMNIRACLDFVISRNVEDLFISCDVLDLHLPLRSTIFSCQSLRELVISGELIYMRVPQEASLPSLKKLEVADLRYLETETLQRLLDISPVLEAFDLALRKIREPTPYTVSSHSLQKLSIETGYNIVSIEVNTPSLKFLNFYDCTIHNAGDIYDGEEIVIKFENMPNLEEADVNVCEVDISSLMESITSVKKLAICSFTDVHYPNEGVVFNRLEQLKLCHCAYCMINPHNLLRASPNVRLLNICKIDEHVASDFDVVHAPPAVPVPNSTLANLQTLIWTEYSGHPPSIDYVYYILENATVLRNVDISFRKERRCTKEYRKDLLRVVRASPACELNIKVNEDSESEEDSE